MGIGLIVKAIRLKQALGEMRDAERVGGHDFPARACEEGYQPLSRLTQKPDNSPRSPKYTEIEDPDTGSLLLIPDKDYKK